MKKNFHPFHILKPSIWPFCFALSLGWVAFSLVLLMHGYKKGNISLISSLIITITLLYKWWSEVITESLSEHTDKIRENLRLGMIFFILSEVMFFFGFFWAFFHSSLIPSVELLCEWPPVDLQNHVIDPMGIPLANTVILLASSVSVTWCHRLLVRPLYIKGEAILALFVTILLAILFLFLQILEYKNATLYISDGIYGSCFYMLTGFHGFHVFVGTLMLVVSLIRLILNHFADGTYVGLESAIWYWHFVDVVWLILFCFVYVWGNQNHNSIFIIS